ncbi:WD40-repeat-containing domain protein [Peziza echinospora]|nr:WD40-repeat-containing domain protein [Peziza echinospora]
MKKREPEVREKVEVKPKSRKGASEVKPERRVRRSGRKEEERGEEKEHDKPAAGEEEEEEPKPEEPKFVKEESVETPEIKLDGKAIREEKKEEDENADEKDDLEDARSIATPMTEFSVTPSGLAAPELHLSEIAADNEYERQRQENILKNRLLLQQLHLDRASLGLGRSQKPQAPKSTQASRSKRVKKEPVVTENAPRRQSSRLAGLPADSQAAKRKAEENYAAIEEADRAKRARVAGDLKFEGLDLGVKGERYARTFTEEDVKRTDNKDVKEMREKMMGLTFFDKWVPNDIRVCSERIYSLAFHPTTDKKLIFAGDKVGNLGIWDASSSKPDPDADEDDPDAELPAITNIKVHSRSIAAQWFPPDAPNIVLTASYDGTIRSFDLVKGLSTEVYVSEDGVGEGISGVEVHDNPNILYFSTLEGRVGRKDTRTQKTDIWTLSEKKIGGFSMHPLHPHLCATASLDRTVKIWDLRQITGAGMFGSGLEKAPAMIGEHTSRLSVSSAYWNARGSLATTSYDDTVKIYKFPEAGKWASGAKIPQAEARGGEEGMIEPSAVMKHNNQTGRWVTILRAQWQQRPREGPQKLVIGNMNRFLDIYDEDGTQLAQLGHELITAVPASAMFHPTEDWVAGGNASGKVVLFS